AFRFGINGVTKVRDKAAEGIVAGVGVVEIAVAETIVELNMFGCERKMRAKERFEMEKCGLGDEAGSGRFVIDLADGSNFGGGDVGDGGENGFESAGGREPGIQRAGEKRTYASVAFAEVYGVV